MKQLKLPENTEVVWQPIRGTSQELAMTAPAHHLLHNGTRGSGKTALQIMKFRRYVGLGYGKHWVGVIFDREYKNLSDIVRQSKDFFPLFQDGAKFLESASEYKWVWPSGEELLFRHAKKESDYDNFHGHQYPYIGFNELTKYPTQTLYDKLCSTNRSGFLPEIHTPHEKVENGDVLNAIQGPDGIWRVYHTHDKKPLPSIPLLVHSTCNPSGAGRNWVKRRFITGKQNGKIYSTKTKVFNPRTKKQEVVEVKQVSIFGSYRENIFLDAKYIAELDRLTENDPNLKKAWLYGSWDATSGGAFDDIWSDIVHIIPRFVIPETWHIDRAFDWGSSHPYAVGWFAEANGEEAILPDGSTFNPPVGTLILIGELYGCEKDKDTGEYFLGTNKGIRATSKEIAQEINEYEKCLLEEGWIKKKVSAGPADNQISNVTERDVDTIEKKMADEGVRWERSDKSAGSRINGVSLMRDRLKAALTKNGEPEIYFFENCQASNNTIPALPRGDEEKGLQDDVDTKAEDHCWDMVRYRVLKSSNRLATKIPVSFY